MTTLAKNGLDLINCIWDKIYKNGPSKICGRQPLKNLKECVLSIYAET